MLRPCTDIDLPAMAAIINNAAQAYRGKIPEDCWHEPYMPMAELAAEIAAGIRFWGYERNGMLHGVMGIQDRGEVTLIRHAYVVADQQKLGISSTLLRHLETLTARPILIGTWKAAIWAISFYRKHAYEQVSEKEKNRLLATYWNIGVRQIETSVVLAKPVDPISSS